MMDGGFVMGGEGIGSGFGGSTTGGITNVGFGATTGYTGGFGICLIIFLGLLSVHPIFTITVNLNNDDSSLG